MIVCASVGVFGRCRERTATAPPSPRTRHLSGRVRAALQPFSRHAGALPSIAYSRKGVDTSDELHLSSFRYSSLCTLAHPHPDQAHARLRSPFPQTSSSTASSSACICSAFTFQDSSISTRAQMNPPAHPPPPNFRPPLPTTFAQWACPSTQPHASVAQRRGGRLVLFGGGGMRLTRI